MIVAFAAVFSCYAVEYFGTLFLKIFFIVAEEDLELIPFCTFVECVILRLVCVCADWPQSQVGSCLSPWLWNFYWLWSCSQHCQGQWFMPSFAKNFDWCFLTSGLWGRKKKLICTRMCPFSVYLSVFDKMIMSAFPLLWRQSVMLHKSTQILISTNYVLIKWYGQHPSPVKT